MAEFHQGVRFFPEATEDIAGIWRERAKTNDHWTPDPTLGDNPGGEAAGYYVTCGPLNGYSKPGQGKEPPSVIPRAALEKISSDLAFELKLPLPPVVLWDRGEPLSEKVRFACIVLLPFMPAHKWDFVSQDEENKKIFLPFLSPVASAMLPFDTWLRNKDRHNGGNVICFEGENGESGVLRTAYIDYSFSMVKAWAFDKEDWKGVQVEENGGKILFPHECSVALTKVAETLKGIENFPDSAIREIVCRIPDEFMVEQHRSMVINALSYRRDVLRTALKQKCQDLP